MKFLKAIRLPNLFIVALTQVILKYTVINPYFENKGIVLSPDNDFILLVLATLSLTMFGYLINDYFDYELDLAAANTVPSGLSKRSLLICSCILLLIGFVISLLLSIRTQLLHLLWIYPIAALLLFMYSKTLKSLGLPGNILVALFTSGVVYITFFAERNLDLSDHGYIQSVVYSFIIFAFLVNLYREMIKDIEDVEADKAYGMMTLPIKIGVVKASMTSFFIGIVLLILIVLFGLTLTSSLFQKMYILVLLALPMSYILYVNHHAQKADDFHRISQFVKCIMLVGLVYLCTL